MNELITIEQAIDLGAKYAEMYERSLEQLATLRAENERLTALVEKIYAEAKEMAFHLNTDTLHADSEVRDSIEYVEMWILQHKSGVDAQ